MYSDDISASLKDTGAWPAQERLSFTEHITLDTAFNGMYAVDEADQQGAYCFSTEASMDLFTGINKYGESA